MDIVSIKYQTKNEIKNDVFILIETVEDTHITLKSCNMNDDDILYIRSNANKLSELSLHDIITTIKSDIPDAYNKAFRKIKTSSVKELIIHKTL